MVLLYVICCFHKKLKGMAESNELFFSLYKINVCMNCTTTMYCKKKMTLSIKNSLYDINTVKNK